MARIIKEPEERRQEILDAAMKLFSEKGYEKTSISDIAQSIGVAQGLCYRYFPSKEALFDAAVDHYAEMQVNQMLPILCDPDQSPLEKIETAPAYPQIEQQNSDYYRVFHGAGSRHFHDRLSLRICEKMAPVLEKEIQKAIGKGEIGSCDARTAASFFIYGQLGILLAQDLSPEEKLNRIRSFQEKILRLL
jgi:AcrR family transcriptional regulator